MRKVIYSELKKLEGEISDSLVEIGEAWFHQFSAEYEEFETGPGCIPVAILELHSGKVITVLAHNIKFIT